MHFPEASFMIFGIDKPNSSLESFKPMSVLSGFDVVKKAVTCTAHRAEPQQQQHSGQSGRKDVQSEEILKRLQCILSGSEV